MKIFIFKHIEKLTDSYHSDGGLVVIAKDIGRAIEMLNNSTVEATGLEIADVISYDLKDEVKEEIFIFPDAGCC